MTNNKKNSEDGLDILREFRTVLQDLQEILSSVSKGDTSLKTYSKYIKKTEENIAEWMLKIHPLRDELDADSIQHIEDLWEQIKINPIIENPDPEKPFDAKDQFHNLNMIQDRIRQMVFEIGWLTIPSRLNEWLINARPGYYIPFHLVFEDEMPLMQDRVRLLNFLASAPNMVQGGLVNAANGLIYRYSRNPWKRMFSVFSLAMVFLLVTGIIVGACYIGLPGWPLKAGDASFLLIGWVAIWVGIIVHFAVGSVKKVQSGGLPQAVPVRDLPLIVDAKLGDYLLKILIALIGLFGAFTTGMGIESNGIDISKIDILKVFLIGYSLDSFVELFGTSIEQQSAAQLSALKKELGVTDQK